MGLISMVKADPLITPGSGHREHHHGQGRTSQPQGALRYSYSLSVLWNRFLQPSHWKIPSTWYGWVPENLHFIASLEMRRVHQPHLEKLDPNFWIPCNLPASAFSCPCLFGLTPNLSPSRPHPHLRACIYTHPVPSTTNKELVFPLRQVMISKTSYPSYKPESPSALLNHFSSSSFYSC